MSKRKYRQREAEDFEGSSSSWNISSDISNRADSVLFLESHEADLVHRQEGIAITLECPDISETSDNKVKKGSGLITWSNENHHETVYVDRYDARLLLTSLPNFQSGTDDLLSPEALSPSGWSDMPSDTEDTFFFSPEEAEDFRREKRRRLLDRDREERLRSLRSETGEDFDDAESIWGGSDEAPDDMQSELMRRTASHILTSQNPAQLEMRILANHGADKRFAFLRGRWKHAWTNTKAEIQVNLEKMVNTSKTTAITATLALGLDGYGDSEEEDEEDDKPNEEQMKVKEPDVDQSIIESRRARAREWIAKRRAQKDIEPP